MASKKSKILAMALCASVMTGIYAAPVMAEDLSVTLDGQGIVAVGSDVTGTLTIAGDDIANALNGKNINLGTGSLIINNKNIGNSVAAIRRVVNEDTGMSATYLEETVKAHSAFGLQVLDEYGKAVATISRNGTGEFNGPLTANKSLTALDVGSKAKSVLGVSGVQLYNSDGTNKVNITNSGASRFGSFDETNVRIEGGALKIMAANNAAVSGPLVAQLSEDGLTLVDANRKYSTLTAAQLANLNSTIKEGGVVDANELNVSGETGGLYIKDVTNEDRETGTMIFAGPSQDGDSTLRIDPKNGNLSTKGTIGVADNNWHTVTQIQGSGENIGDIAVGIQYNGEGNITGQNIVLDASTGDVISKGTLSGTGLTAEGADGGLYVQDVQGTAGKETMIFAGPKGGYSTLRIDPTNGNFMTKGTMSVADENWNAVTQIQGSGENIGDIAVGINYNTDDTVAGANIILDADTGNVVAKGGITAADFNDVTLAKNGEQVLVGGIDISALKEGVDTANDAVGGIRRSEGAGEPGTGTTTIEKATSFDANGMRVTNENDGRAVEITKDRGIEVFGGNGVSNAVIARNGTARFGAEAGLNVSIKNGDVTSTYYDEEGKVGHYSLNNIGDKTQNMWADGSQTKFSHSVNVEGSFSSGNGAVNLKGNWGEEASIELRDAKNKTYTLTATQLGNINNMITDAGVLENVVSINGAAVEGVGNGGLKISKVTLEKGGIWADKLNGKLIEEYVTDDEISGDLENIGGIDRKDVTGEGKPGEGTTTIENLLNVSGDSVSASLGNNSFTFDNSGFKFTGVVNLGSASDIYFNYGGVGNGTDYAGSYTLEDLADTVADIYDRTQAIDYENGKTTIKGDLDVVKDPNAGSGEGGDPGTGEGGNTGNGNGHYDGNLDVDGGITAGDSTIGGVGLEGGTVTADKVVTGNTTLDNEVLNVGGQTSVTADGVNVGGNGGTTVSKDGVSIADKTIISDHDVVINEGTADRVSLSETADRVGNLEQGVSELNNRVGELEDRIDKVGAMAAAIANLRTMGYDPAAPTEVAVGIGQYRDETGAALGLFHYPNRDFMLSLSVSTSGDEVMGGIGATWKFGRKSPEKVAEIKKAQAEADARRAEEAKLAKAEEMKQAAKEAKIKAQQERHAKLAAERAAQAEAAK